MAKTIVIIAALFPLISISAMQAVRSVSVRKLHAAQSLGAGRATIFRRVLPASLPGIFTGMRVSVGIGLTMLVGAEMVATSDGVAWMALTAADLVQTDVVLVGVLIMAALGYGLDQIFRAVEPRARGRPRLTRGMLEKGNGPVGPFRSLDNRDASQQPA